MWQARWFPEASTIVQHGDKAVLLFTCEHEAHPKTIDASDPVAPNPVTAGQTCDFWSGKNDYAKYGGYPQVCYNCFHSIAMEITEEDMKD
jgi:hypothetical protein